MYTVKKGARVATVNVDTEIGGDAEKIVFSDYFRVFSVRNEGSNVMYISFDDVVTPEADGTYMLPPKTTVNIAYVLTSNYINVQGQGTVIVAAANTYVPFYESNAVVQSSGGNSGSGESVEETTNADVDELFKD